MSKITKSARGEECQVRIPGVCNHNPETTIFAHLRGGGMGKKQPDSEGAYCCSDCHDLYDGRAPLRPYRYLPQQFVDLKDSLGEPVIDGMARIYVDVMFSEGCTRTRKLLIKKELLICL